MGTPLTDGVGNGDGSLTLTFPITGSVMPLVASGTVVDVPGSDFGTVTDGTAGTAGLLPWAALAPAGAETWLPAPAGVWCWPGKDTGCATRTAAATTPTVTAAAVCTIGSTSGPERCPLPKIDLAVSQPAIAYTARRPAACPRST